MPNAIQVIPNKVAAAVIKFDEQAYIDEALRVLVELHGSYNLQDQRLVCQMAAAARTYAIADTMLTLPNDHLQYTGSNGIQPHSWLKIRETSTDRILKIRKDLGMDIASRKELPPQDGDVTIDDFLNQRKSAFA